MIKVRLLRRVRMDGILFEKGLVLPLPPKIARQVVMAGHAVYAEPEKAVVGPQEMRSNHG